jgi:type 1 glutamine amidotransferase
MSWTKALVTGTVALLCSAAASAQNAPNPGAATPPAGAAAAPRAPVDPWPGMKRLLVIADVQNGYHHDSISHAMATIEQMGRQSGKWMTIIKTDSQVITKSDIVGTGTRYGGRSVNARNLDFFDAVFFLGSGSGTLTDQQKADLLSFVREDGKGFVAGHASGVAYFDWPEFTQLLGAPMESEYPTGVMSLLRKNATFPGAAAFPAEFTYNDQFPVTPRTFSSRDVNVLFALDPTKMTPEQLARRPDGDFPIIWYDTVGAGRVFNLGVGHREEVWDDPKFRAMASGAIEWALGLVDENGNPIQAP